jgi:hypothetical protein
VIRRQTIVKQGFWPFFAKMFGSFLLRKLHFLTKANLFLCVVFNGHFQVENGK